MTRRCAIVLVALLLLPSPTSTLSAQTVSRRVFVGVVDNRGQPVLGLTAADFDVTENGVKRQTSRVALDTAMRVVLLVDTSSPMGQELNHLRPALDAFLAALPPEHEVALISTGGQIRIRERPTADRDRLRKTAASISSDGGANAFIETLLEADRRFLKSAPDKWPVFVIVTTDAGTSRAEPALNDIGRFFNDFLGRGGSAHALVVRDRQLGIVTDVARNLVENAGGMFETMTLANSLPERMKAIAERLAADHRAMAGRYEVEYTSDAKTVTGVEVRVPGGVQLRLSGRRPF